ncbi:MAG: 2-dehydropantoate 2-reductase N-terminal domain-containing protein, partial [Patescibacteria group bacterium]
MAETKATILGAGAIGMAMAVVLSDTGHKVVFWDIEPTVLDGINKKHLNPRSLSHIKLEKNVSAEADLQKAVFGAEIIVIALSSRAVREVSLKLKDVLARNCVVISASKGLEAGSLAVMT